MDVFLHCASACDDQVLINELYFDSGTRWTDYDENHLFEQTTPNKGGAIPEMQLSIEPPEKQPPPVKPYKTGIMDSELRTSRFDTRQILLQILVVAEDDIKRGGSPEDCESTWILNPVLKLRTRNNRTMTQRYRENPYKKLEIFNDFESC